MSVLIWAVYCVLISAILLAAASAWEVAARWWGRPSRVGWLVALAGSVTLPWVLRLIPDNVLVDVMPFAMPAFVLDPISATAGTSSGWTLREAGVVAWIAMSGLMVTYVCGMMYVLSRARRAWRTEHIDGGPVLVSAATGPAALGVGRAAVVLPAWVLELEADMRSMLLRHERSHVEAGDPRLLFAGLLLLAAMPWNPIVWFQFLRLRNAIELDCDARVLRGGADPVDYGSLLLEVGRRRSAGTFVMATFAEPRVFLRERIRRIAEWPLERRGRRAAAFAALAVFMFGAALSCDPADVSKTVDSAATPDEQNRLDTLRDRLDPGRDYMTITDDSLAARPVFTPYTQQPELLNARQSKERLNSYYPPLLRDAGIGGRTLLWFFIDETGKVLKTQVKESSGYEALDAAAMQVASKMEFSPALNRGRPVNVWVEVPIVFTPGSDRQSAVRAQDRVGVPVEMASRPQAERGPNEKPELLDASRVQRQLVETYPPLLRDAGIGGRTLITFSIDANGKVQGTTMKESSGYEALDAAALAIAAGMEFLPARRDGKDVATTMDIPVVFTAK